MKKVFYIILILSFVSLAAGCNRSNEAKRHLLAAEAIIEERPDSALLMLEYMNPDTIEGDSLPTFGDVESDALYGLLLTQAQTKMRMIVTDHSDIDRAVSYFEKNGDDKRLMKSLFYQGRVNFNRREYSRAVVPAQRALDIARDLNDDYWRAKSAELIMDILNHTFKEDEAVNYSKEAVEYYEKAGRIDNHRYAICDLALNYSQTGRRKEALALIDSILDIERNQPTDSMLVAYGLGYKISVLMDMKRYDDAYKNIQEYMRFSNYMPMTAVEYMYLFNIAISKNMPQEYINSLVEIADSISKTDTERVGVYGLKMDVYRALGRLDDALAASDSMINIQNKVFREFLNQSVIAAQRDYYIDASDREKGKSRQLSFVLIAICIVVAVAIVVGIVFYRMRMRMKDMAIERKVGDIYYLAEQSRILTSEAKLRAEQAQEIEGEMASLYRDKWSTLNMLCNEFYEKGENEVTRRSILTTIEGEISKFKKKEELDRVGEMADKYMDGIVSKVREQMSELKENDITLLTLVFADFSPRAVCLMLGISKANYYAKKKRLREKIEDSDAPDKALFLRYLK